MPAADSATGHDARHPSPVRPITQPVFTGRLLLMAFLITALALGPITIAVLLEGNDPQTPIAIMILFVATPIVFVLSYGTAYGVAGCLRVVAQRAKHRLRPARAGSYFVGFLAVLLLSVSGLLWICGTWMETGTFVIATHGRSVSTEWLVWCYRYATTRENYEILYRLADRDDTPSEVLEALARHAEPTVRSTVADNRRLSRQSLDALSRDSDDYVRRSVCHNRAAPAEILQRLASDPVPSVSRAARERLMGLR